MKITNTWLFLKPIAHRGLHDAQAPENSLAAFKKAKDAGYPIELDVRIIDDGTVIVFHDEKLCRLTGSDGYVTNLVKEKLKDYKILKTDEKIPTFEEALETINGQVPILIEIKNNHKVGMLERKVLEILKGYDGEYAVQSFNPYTIEYFKNCAPHIMRGQLSSFFIEEKSLGALKKFVLKRMLLNRISRPDFISYEHKYLPNIYVTRTKLPVLAWTVRSQQEYEDVKMYCNNIIFENFIPVVENKK
ncbi:MAG TPA: glycerophosphodiester phosphodiesterase family protein [Clostridia bacterium]